MALREEPELQKSGLPDFSRMRVNPQSLPDEELRSVDYSAWMARMSEKLQRRIGDLLADDVLSQHKRALSAEHDGIIRAVRISRSISATEWDNEVISFGGKRITQAQASMARQRVLDNSDYYIEWALKNGVIKDRSQGQEMIQDFRRSQDLHNDIRTRCERNESIPHELEERAKDADEALEKKYNPLIIDLVKDYPKENIKASIAVEEDLVQTVRKSETEKTFSTVDVKREFSTAADNSEGIAQEPKLPPEKMTAYRPASVPNAELTI